MTVRYDADRQRIAQQVATTFGWLTTANHTPSHLRAKIDLEIEDGLKAATYDGDGRGGGDGSSFPERAAANERSDRACEALSDLDRALSEIAKWERVLFGIIDRFDPINQRQPGEVDKRTPGKGKAPAGKCSICWKYGTPEDIDRYEDACRWCGDERAKIGRIPPVEVWRIHQQGRRVNISHYRTLAPEIARSLGVG